MLVSRFKLIQYYLHFFRKKAQSNLLIFVRYADHVRKQLDNLTNHMNDGYARWQSQYLRLLRIPNVKHIPSKLKEGMLSSYDSNNLDGINFYMNEIVAHEKKNPSANPQKASEQQLCFDFT